MKRASQRAPVDLVVPVRSRLLVVSPHMDDEVQPLAVHVVDQRIEAVHLGRVVGRIAEHAEHHAGRGRMRAPGEESE